MKFLGLGIPELIIILVVLQFLMMNRKDVDA